MKNEQLRIVSQKTKILSIFPVHLLSAMSDSKQCCKCIGLHKLILQYTSCRLSLILWHIKWCIFLLQKLMKLCTWSFLGWWSQFTTYHIVHSCAFASKALYICIFLASVACAYIVIYNWMHGPLYISTLNEMKRNPLAFSRKNNWMHGWFDYATIYIFFSLIPTCLPTVILCLVV